MTPKVKNLSYFRLNQTPWSLPTWLNDVMASFIEWMGGMMKMWEMRDEIRKLKYQPPMAVMMAEMELRNFIDGKRSILDIRNAASAEFAPIGLLDVEKWVNIQAQLGLVEIKKK